MVHSPLTWTYTIYHSLILFNIFRCKVSFRLKVNVCGLLPLRFNFYCILGCCLLLYKCNLHVFLDLVGHLYISIRIKTWESNSEALWNGTLHGILLLSIFSLISTRDTNCISYYTDTKLKSKKNLRKNPQWTKYKNICFSCEFFIY